MAKINFKKMWDFIKGKIAAIIIIVALITIAAVQCSRIENLKRQHAIDNQNQIAMKDSLKFVKKKNGELEVSIAGYIANEKDLKKLNEDLWKRVKAQDGNVLFLNRAIIQLKQDSTALRLALVEKDKLIEKLSEIDKDTYAALWVLPYQYDSTNFDIFRGHTLIKITNKNPLEFVHMDTELLERLTQIDLTWGQEVVKDQLRVFVTSSYPGFTVKSMEGVMIDPNNNPYIKSMLKKKHWFQGFGVGPQITTGYNFTTGKYGFVIGGGLHYTIYRF